MYDICICYKKKHPCQMHCFESFSSAKPFQMCLKTDGVESGPSATGFEVHPASTGATVGFSISKY